jgi:hypothetical protein
MPSKGDAFDSFALPKALFDAARVKAEELGTTRSDLYRIAIESILEVPKPDYSIRKSRYIEKYGETHVGRPKGFKPKRN